METFETVRECCKHKDCRYRGYLSTEPACFYMLITGKRRGRDISQCDKYKTGKVRITSSVNGFAYLDGDDVFL